LDGHLAHAASLASIRLAHACPHAPWVNDVSHWAILVLKEEFASVDSSLEAKMTSLACLLIGSRSVPLPERSSTLTFCFENIHAHMPCTTMAPHGIHSPGLLLESRGLVHYRRPARVAMLAEIALSFFLDGPIETTTTPQRPPTTTTTTRSTALETFLKSATIASAVKENQTGKVIQFREEIVIAFCMVAAGVGRRHRSPPDDGEKLGVTGSQDDFVEWIRMSLSVLNACISCIGWGGSPAYLEEDLSLLVAAQASYVRLVQEVLHAAGLLNSKSVSLKMAPTASPPNMLWDQMEESAAFLGKYDYDASIQEKSQ
jgi:hypothetical protein